MVNQSRNHDTYSELNWDGEEVDTPKGLADFITSWDTGKVNKGWFDNTLLAIGCVHSCQHGFLLEGGGSYLNDRLRHSEASKRHRKSGRTTTVLGRDNFVTTELDA